MLTKYAPNGHTVFCLPKIQLMAVSAKMRRATVLALFGSSPNSRVVQAAISAARTEYERLAVIRTDGHAKGYALDTVYEGRPLVLDCTKENEHQQAYLWQDVTDEWAAPDKQVVDKARRFVLLGEGSGLGSLTIQFPTDEDYNHLMGELARAGKNRGKGGPDYGLPAEPSDVSDEHPMTQKEREAVGVVREAIFNLLDDLTLQCVWCGKANDKTRTDCVTCKAGLHPVPVKTVAVAAQFKDSAGSRFVVMVQRPSAGQTLVRSEGNVQLICWDSELVYPHPGDQK